MADLGRGGVPVGPEVEEAAVRGELALRDGLEAEAGPLRQEHGAGALDPARALHERQRLLVHVVVVVVLLVLLVVLVVIVVGVVCPLLLTMLLLLMLLLGLRLLHQPVPEAEARRVGRRGGGRGARRRDGLDRRRLAVHRLGGA